MFVDDVLELCGGEGFREIVVRAQGERAAAVVETAMALKRSPYRLGGRDPATGFDCSGLVWFVFSEHAITLPRTVAEQVHAGRRIDRRRIEAGDLVFFATTGRGTSHVGIAIDGEQFIHAPDTGAVVRIEQLDAAYWRRRFTGARRII